MAIGGVAVEWWGYDASSTTTDTATGYGVHIGALSAGTFFLLPDTCPPCALFHSLLSLYLPLLTNIRRLLTLSSFPLVPTPGRTAPVYSLRNLSLRMTVSGVGLINPPSPAPFTYSFRYMEPPLSLSGII